MSCDNSDSAEKIQTECLPLFRHFTSGRVERLMGTATVPPPPNSKDVTIKSEPKICARLYLPNKIHSNYNITASKKLPILVYYHGGGFCIESAFSPTYQSFLTRVADDAEMVVVSVDYRLAPENLLPAAYDDAWVALEWVFGVGVDEWVRDWGDLGRVWVGGDSAGANISHQMALRAAHMNGPVKLEGMILMHAYFWGSDTLPSEKANLGARAWLDRLWKVITPPEMQSLDHPMSNPIAKDAPSLKGLGCDKIIVCVAEKDPLVERGKAYYEAVKNSGWEGDIELVVTEGEEHVFHLLKPESEQALELIGKVVAFIGKK